MHSNAIIVAGRTSVSEQSPEEMKLACKAAMGERLGPLYYVLWQEIAWLHMKWHQYVVLFGTKESRVALLNEAAPAFFRTIEDSLWENVLLHISRLTDPPGEGATAKLTIKRCHALVDDFATAQKVKAAVEKAVDLSSFCRDWRNRHIAHRNLSLALKVGATPLVEASREKVRLVLAALVEVLDIISQHYQGTTNLFECDGFPGGAEALLYIVDSGVRAQTERYRRLLNGEAEADDVRTRDV
jgi:hypothetical protein